MTQRDDDLRVRPGRIRSRGDGHPKTFIGEVDAGREEGRAHR